jgi:hypothetical protein
VSRNTTARSRGGAKATRAGRPWSIGARFGPFESRAEAQRVEYQVKRLRGRERLSFRARVDLRLDLLQSPNRATACRCGSWIRVVRRRDNSPLPTTHTFECDRLDQPSYLRGSCRRCIRSRSSRRAFARRPEKELDSAPPRARVGSLRPWYRFADGLLSSDFLHLPSVAVGTHEESVSFSHGALPRMNA